LSGIRRIKLLIDKLSSNRYAAPIEEILSYLEDEDIEVTRRTLHRDFIKIQEEFGQIVETTRIEYNGRRVKGYKINTNESADYDDVLSFINIASAVEQIKTKLGTSVNPGNYISIGKGSSSGGAIWLNLLIGAIVNSKMVNFKYLKYGATEPSERSVEPYYLKSHNHIWYLLAKQEDSDKLKVYGLDRAYDVSVTASTFRRSKNFKPANFFKNHIGVLVDQNNSVEKIVIEVFKPFAGKVKTNPLHVSQKITEETEGMIRIEVVVVPSGEFFTEILRMRNHAKIISPDFVRIKIKQIIESMAKNYL
jgi:hypothetical protein